MYMNIFKILLLDSRSRKTHLHIAPGEVGSKVMDHILMYELQGVVRNGQSAIVCQK